MNEQVLKDLIATAQSNNYNWDVIRQKFPELNGYELQSLKDYVATAEHYNYDYAVINPKFPEFFSPQEKPVAVKKKDSTDLSLDESPLESPSLVSGSPQESLGFVQEQPEQSLAQANINADSLINANLINADETDVVSMLTENFGKYGFVFEEASPGIDQVIARTADGSQSFTLELDSENLRYLNQGSEGHMSRFNDFIKRNAKPEYSIDNEDYLSKALRMKGLRNSARRNEDGTVSTVKAATFESDGKYYVAPTLFPKNPNYYTSDRRDWIEPEDPLRMAFERGEVFEFATADEAERFAAGEWKNISTLDLEASRFFNERGLDYMSMRNVRDEYDSISNLIEESEQQDQPSEYVNEIVRSIQSTALRTLPGFEFIPDLDFSFLSGEDDKLSSLKERQSQLADVLFYDDRTREAFDDWSVYANKRGAEKAKEAYAMSQVADEEMRMVDNHSRAILGIPAQEIPQYNFEDPEVQAKADQVYTAYQLLQDAKEYASNGISIAETYFDSQTNKQVNQDFIENWEAVTEMASQGWNNGQAGWLITAVSLGIDPTGYNLEEASERERLASDITKYRERGQGPTSRAMSGYFNARSTKEAMAYVVNDPFEWTASLAAQSMSQMLPLGLRLVPAAIGSGAAAGAAIGLLGGPFAELTVPAGALKGAIEGFRTGMAATNLGVEYFNAFFDMMVEDGKDPNDPQQVLAAMESQEHWNKTRERGLKRGIPIAMVDYLSASLAGRVFVRPLASTATRIGTAAANQMVYGPGSEALGEYLAQITAGQEVDAKEIIAEAGGSFGNNSANLAINMYQQSSGKYVGKLANNLASPEYVSGSGASAGRILSWTERQHSRGRISDEQKHDIERNVGFMRQANKAMTGTETPKKRPNTKVRARVMELMDAREQLSDRKEQSFSPIISRIQEEISQTILTGKVQRDGFDTSSLGGIYKDKYFTYRINGEAVEKDDFQQHIDSLSDEEFILGLMDGSVQTSRDKDGVKIINDRINAIQEQATDEVPVLEEPETGEQVGEGVRSPEELTPEEETQEAVEDEVAALEDIVTDQQEREQLTQRIAAQQPVGREEAVSESEPVTNILGDLSERGRLAPHPDLENTWVYGENDEYGVQFSLVPSGTNGVMIDQFAVLGERGQGLGTQAMTAIVEAADKNNLPLNLVALPPTSEQFANDEELTDAVFRLAKFYQKSGFILQSWDGFGAIMNRPTPRLRELFSKGYTYDFLEKSFRNAKKAGIDLINVYPNDEQFASDITEQFERGELTLEDVKRIIDSLGQLQPEVDSKSELDKQYEEYQNEKEGVAPEPEAEVTPDAETEVTDRDRAKKRIDAGYRANVISGIVEEIILNPANNTLALINALKKLDAAARIPSSSEVSPGGSVRLSMSDGSDFIADNIIRNIDSGEITLDDFIAFAKKFNAELPEAETEVEQQPKVEPEIEPKVEPEAQPDENDPYNVSEQDKAREDKKKDKWIKVPGGYEFRSSDGYVYTAEKDSNGNYSLRRAEWNGGYYYGATGSLVDKSMVFPDTAESMLFDDGIKSLKRVKELVSDDVVTRAQRAEQQKKRARIQTSKEILKARNIALYEGEETERLIKIIEEAEDMTSLFKAFSEIAKGEAVPARIVYEAILKNPMLNDFQRQIAQSIVDRLQGTDDYIFFAFINEGELTGLTYTPASGAFSSYTGALKEKGAIIEVQNPRNTYAASISEDRNSYNGEASLITLLHEGLHAVTKPQMEELSSEFSSEMLELFIEVINYIKENEQSLRQSHPILEAYFRGANNSLKDHYELLAWGLSSDEMMALLKDIPYKTNRNAWDTFVDAIRKLLGLPNKPEVTNALEGLLNAYALQKKEATDNAKPLDEVADTDTDTKENLRMQEDSLKQEIVDERNNLKEAIAEIREQYKGKWSVKGGMTFTVNNGTRYEVTKRDDGDFDVTYYDENGLSYTETMPTKNDAINYVKESVVETRDDAIENAKDEAQSLIDDLKEQLKDVRAELKKPRTSEMREGEVTIEPTQSNNPSFAKGSMKTLTLDGGTLEIGRVQIGDDPNDVSSILELFVPEESRRKGIATKLLQAALKETGGMLSGMASNAAAVELNYKVGMRAFDELGRRLNLEQTIAKLEQSGHYVLMYAREAAEARGFFAGFDMPKNVEPTLAPNGMPSLLSPELYRVVRTEAFKSWFGDWENDPENASKVLDMNGEPKVVYHGSPNENIRIFDEQKAKESRVSGLKEFGYFFTDDPTIAEIYAEKSDTGTPTVYPLFLNIRNMHTFDAKEKAFNQGAWRELKVDLGYKLATGTDAVEALAGRNTAAPEARVDGIKADNIIDIAVSESSEVEPGEVYVVWFDSAQNIKLADGSNTTFDGGSLSISEMREDAFQPATETDAASRAVVAERGTNLNLTGKEAVVAGRTSPTVKNNKKTGPPLSDDFRLDNLLVDNEGLGGETLTVNSAGINFILKLGGGTYTYTKTNKKTKKKTIVTVKLPFEFKNDVSLINRRLNARRALKDSGADLKKKAKIDNLLREQVKRVYLDMVSIMTQNILAVYDTLTPEFVDASKEWYVGANRMANKLAKNYGVTLEQAAAMIAALSPQNEWFNNVSGAERFFEVMTNYRNEPITRDVYDRVRAYNMRNAKDNKPTGFVKAIDGFIKKYEGKSISELEALGVNDKQLGIAVRILDQANISPNTLSTDPDGKYLGDSGGVIQWNSPDEMAKAYRLFNARNIDDIVNNLGGGNKVRNFYNNIVDPKSPKPFVTADTHALSVALGVPASANDASGFGLFSGGFSVPYMLVKEAYIQASNITGLNHPREMQSITWEAQRAGVNDPNRTAAKKAENEALLNQLLKDETLSPYERTRIIIDQNRSKESGWTTARGIATQKGLPELQSELGNQTRQRVTEVLSVRRSSGASVGKAVAVVGQQVVGGISISEMREGVEPGDADSPMRFEEGLDIYDVIQKGRDAGFKDASILEYLRRNGFTVREAKAAMDIPLDITTSMPPAFGNVVGGARVGLKMFNEIKAKLSAFARKKGVTAVDVRAEAQRLLESRPEFKTASETVQAQMRTGLEANLQGKRNKKVSEAIKQIKKDLKQRALGASEVRKVQSDMKKFISANLPKEMRNKASVKRLLKRLADSNYSNLPVVMAEALDILDQIAASDAKLVGKVNDLKSKLNEARINAKSLKIAKAEARIFIRKNLPVDKYGKRLIGKLITMATNATPDTIGKDGQLTENSISRVMANVVDEVNIHTSNKLMDIISDIFKGQFITMTGDRIRGRISPESQDRLNGIKSLMADRKATPDTIEGKIAEIREAMSSLNEQPITEMLYDRMVDLHLVLAYNEALLSEDKEANKVVLLEQVADELTNIFVEGRNELKDRLRQRHMNYNELKSRVFKDVTGGVVIDFSDPDSIALANLEVEKMQISEDKKSQIRKVLLAPLNAIDTFLKQGEDLAGIIDRISKLPGEIFGGDTQEIIRENINSASREFKEGRNILMNIVQQKAQQVFGKDYKNIMEKNGMHTETYYIDPDEAARLEEEIEKTNNPKEKKKLQEQLDSISATISQNEMYYLYNQFKDPANHAGFETKFGPKYVEIMAEIESKLDAKVREWADWQVNELFPALYDRYNEVYRAIYDTNMPWNEFYAGRIVREGDFSEDINFVDSTKYRAYVGSDSTKLRKRNKRAIKTRNGDSSLNGYLNEMEFFRAYAEPMRDITKVINAPEVKNAITAFSGKENYDILKTMIDRVMTREINKSDKTETLDLFVNAFVTSKLGFSPQVFMKQATSVLAFQSFIGTSNWAKYSAKAMAGGIGSMNKYWKEWYANSSVLQDRYENSNITRVLENYSDKRAIGPLRIGGKTILSGQMNENVVEVMMWLVKQGDKMGVMGGIANYLYYKEKYLADNPSATENEAMKYAADKAADQAEKTQQSSDTQNKDVWQTGNKFARVFSMFASSSRALARMEMNAFRQLYRAATGKAYKGTVTGALRDILIYHVVMPMAVQWISSGFFGLLRDTGEDDDKDLLRAAILGNINSLFVIGDFINIVADIATDKPWAGSLKTLPAFTFVYEVSDNIAKAMEYGEKASALTERSDRDKRSEFEIKQSEHMEKATIALAAMFTGIPANNIVKFVDNLSKVGEAEDNGEMIMRLLNYSEYQIQRGKQEEESRKGMSKTDMKTYFPEMYEDLYGKGGSLYDVEQEKKQLRQELRDMEKEARGE